MIKKPLKAVALKFINQFSAIFNAANVQFPCSYNKIIDYLPIVNEPQLELPNLSK